jgi:ubiquinone/menaquinone biosynthesis C-methylase UbiE
MSERYFGKTYGANPAESYERFFVPAIGAPVADELIQRAAIRSGERVLDVACGTGIVARRAVEQTGTEGAVTGIDINPAMLAVARAVATPEDTIDWREASAESMPLPDDSFDVVLCQMGLQFMPDKPAALREMRRVGAPRGRFLANMPGPAAPVFAALAEGLERHVGAEAAAAMRHVFSLADTAEIEGLLRDAGFDDTRADTWTTELRLPPPKSFLWQYIESTPLAAVVARADDTARAGLEQDVLAQWQRFEADGALVCEQRFVIGRGRS